MKEEKACWGYVKLFSFLVMFMSENPSHKRTQRFSKVNKYIYLTKYSSVTDVAIALYKTLHGNFPGNNCVLLMKLIVYANK